MWTIYEGLNLQANWVNRAVCCYPFSFILHFGLHFLIDRSLSSVIGWPPKIYPKHYWNELLSAGVATHECQEDSLPQWNQRPQTSYSDHYDSSRDWNLHLSLLSRKCLVFCPKVNCCSGLHPASWSWRKYCSKNHMHSLRMGYPYSRSLWWMRCHHRCHCKLVAGCSFDHLSRSQILNSESCLW